MAYICRATWTVKDGSMDTVLDALAHVSPASRAEPGVRFYQAYRDPGVPAVVQLFEVYDDEAAFQAHCDSEHFRTWVLGTVVPVLEDRRREFFVTVDA